MEASFGLRRKPQVSVAVHIAETAFLAILVSAIEAFPARYEGKQKSRRTLPEGEVFGLLFGQRMDREESTVYNATIAIPMQIVQERTADSVTPSSRHFERIRSVLEAYPMLQFLDNFHSHPWAKEDYAGVDSTDVSSADEETALADAEEYGEEILEVVIGLTYLLRKVNAAPDIRRACMQNYCGNYKYSIAAYVTHSDEGALEMVDNLICPLGAGVGNYDLLDAED
jgi:hypothetical protein